MQSLLLKKNAGISIYTELANKYNLPVQVIKVICNHPFLFASKKMSEGDTKPLMFTYLGKIKMKKRYAKENSQTEEITR